MSESGVPITVVADVQMRPVAISAARVLRDAVLRAGYPPGGSVYPGDDAPATLHLGAFAGARLIGVASICREAPPDTHASGAWRLRGMATTTDARGHGIGRQMALACVAHARGLGASMIWCSAREETVAFYARLGFVPFGDPFCLPEYSDRTYRQMRLALCDTDAKGLLWPATELPVAAEPAQRCSRSSAKGLAGPLNKVSDSAVAVALLCPTTCEGEEV